MEAAAVAAQAAIRLVCIKKKNKNKAAFRWYGRLPYD